eukprot:superscaffoldBa00004076_g18216
MSVPGILVSAARSFSLTCPSASLLRSRLLGASSIKRRNMTSRRQMDHLERTASNSRQNALYPAKVCGIINESETVKRLRIAVHPDFSFKAGQWVDFFIPGVEKVGGFSMCSSPGLLQREGVIELAVKYSKHPPAHWIHTTRSIMEACREFPDKLSCDFHVTQQSTDVDSHLQPFIKHGRITEEQLRAHVDPQRTLCYLCGPPPMIEAVSKTLMELGLPKDRIIFEKWW